MKKFIYTSATSSHGSMMIKDEIKYFSFHQNEVYELPTNDPLVKSFIAQGLLQIQKPSKKEK